MTIPHYWYRIETRKKMIARDIAPDVLSAAKQKKTTFAIRGDNDVTIMKQVVVCASCGKEKLAYDSGEGSFKNKPRIEIEKWSTRQLSLLEEPPKTMSFNNPVSEIAHFIYPRCNVKLTPSTLDLHVMIRIDKNRIKIMR